MTSFGRRPFVVISRGMRSPAPTLCVPATRQGFPPQPCPKPPGSCSPMRRSSDAEKAPTSLIPTPRLFPPPPSSFPPRVSPPMPHESAGSGAEERAQVTLAIRAAKDLAPRDRGRVRVGVHRGEEPEHSEVFDERLLLLVREALKLARVVPRSAPVARVAMGDSGFPSRPPARSRARRRTRRGLRESRRGPGPPPLSPPVRARRSR